MDNLPLVLDLLAWVGEQPRRYADVMDAWRTSCPRLTIWEDALDAGLVNAGYNETSTRMVSITDKGRELLESQRPAVRRQSG